MPYRADVIPASSGEWLRGRLAAHEAYAAQPLPERLRAMHAADAHAIRAELARRGAGQPALAPAPDLVSPASDEERSPRGDGREVDHAPQLARP